MANELQATLGLDMSDFMAGLDNVLKETEKVATKIGKALTVGITAPLTAMAAISVKLFDKQIKSENRLRSALEANGGQVEELMANYKEFADDLTSISLIGGDSVNTMLAMATSMGATGENAKKATLEAFALSKALGVSETSALQATVALQSGSTEMFNRYIPSLKGVTDESKRIVIIQEALAKMMGAITAEAKSGLGPWEMLKSRVESLMESYGSLILDALNPLLTFLNRVVTTIGTLTTEQQALIVKIGILAASIGPVLLGFGSFLAISGPLLTALGSIAVAFGTIILPILVIGASVLALIGMWDDLVISSNMLAEDISSIFSSFVDYILEIFGVDLAQAPKKFNEIFNSVIEGSKTFVTSVLSALINLPRLILNKVVGLAIKALNLLLEGYNDVVTKVGGTAIPLIDFKPFKANFVVQWDDVIGLTDTAIEGIKSVAEKGVVVLSKVGKDLGTNFIDNIKKGLDKTGISGIISSISGAIVGANNTTPQGGKTIQDISSSITPTASTQQDTALDPFDFDKDTKLSELEEFAKVNDDIGTNLMTMWGGVWSSFSQGFGDAMASAIVDGESFSEVMTSLWKTLAKQIISSIAQILIQWVASQVVQRALLASASKAEIKTRGALAYAGGIASMSAAPFPINLTAPFFASAMQGLALSAMGMTAFATGGITTGPTNALIGEAGQEAVIPLDKMDSIMGAREQTITIELDGRAITNTVIRNMPREVRLRTGIIM